MPKRLKYKYHTVSDLPEKGSEYILVYGSNLAGLLGTDIGNVAQFQFGAESGIYLGLSGKSYAIPVKDRFIRLLTTGEIQKYVDMFVSFSNEKPDLKFWVTDLCNEKKGYKPYYIAPLFRGCSRNCVFPLTWKAWLK